jgi:hypothetical protein
MRRMLGRIALALIVVLLWDWSPDIPPLPGHSTAQVRAQTVFPLVGPGGTLIYSNASVTNVNNGNEISLFQYIVPAAYVATGTNVPAGAATPIFTATATTSSLWETPQPMHFRALGLLAGGAATTLNLGINFGGTVATIVLNNNIIGAISGPGTPARLDVWLAPIASTTATPNAVNNFFMAARFAYVNSSGTETVVNGSTIAAVNLASPTVLNVVSRWGAAATGSMLTFFERILKLGE